MWILFKYIMSCRFRNMHSIKFKPKIHTMISGKITSLCLLDWTMRFQWQRHSRDEKSHASLPPQRWISIIIYSVFPQALKLSCQACVHCRKICDGEAFDALGCIVGCEVDISCAMSTLLRECGQNNLLNSSYIHLKCSLPDMIASWSKACLPNRFKCNSVLLSTSQFTQSCTKNDQNLFYSISWSS